MYESFLDLIYLIICFLVSIFDIATALSEVFFFFCNDITTE